MSDTNRIAADYSDAKRASIIRLAEAENPMWAKLKAAGYQTPSEDVLWLIPALTAVRLRTPRETWQLRDGVMANGDEIFDLQRRGLLNGRAQTLVLAYLVFYSLPQYLSKSLRPDKRIQLEQLSDNIGIDLNHFR